MPYDQRIPVIDAVGATWIIMGVLAVALIASIRRGAEREILPPSVSQELKGVAVLAVVFGHIGFFLVDDHRLLWPLSIASGLGVDIFLFLSGYGLTVGMMKATLGAGDFYHRRLLRVFIPLWIALVVFFILDALVLGRTYPASYVIRSLLGLFPVADMATDVNSAFWYITWILLYYLLFPIFFVPRRPWLSAVLLFVAGTLVVELHPAWFAQVIRLYQVHTLAFPLGVLAAWGLYSLKWDRTPLRAVLQQWRETLSVPWYACLLLGLTVIVGYLATHSGVNQGPWREQSINILILLALLALFSVKKFNVGLFALFGLYSYEIYLLHWPLLARYDQFFHRLPAWLAILVYLLLFVALAWAMQKLTEPVGALFERRRKSSAKA